MTLSLTRWLRQCAAALRRPNPSPARQTLTRPLGSAQAVPAGHVPTRIPSASRQTRLAPPVQSARTPSTRIIEWETAANGSARTLGRVVLVGKFSEICAELDRLAALEMA